jgi:aspartate carbamoyltransferase regulatory subunit
LNSSEEGLYVRKIKEGTVIDHIPAGRALIVLKILGITGKEGLRVAVVMNVESSRLGVKDIVKIEGKYLNEEDVNKISLIAPTATVNVIHNYKVIKKFKVKPPETIEGIIRCPNPTCITRKSREPIRPKFKLVQTNPIKLQCVYCGSYITEEEVVEQLTSSH